MLNIIRRFELNVKNVSATIQKSQYCQSTTSNEEIGNYKCNNSSYNYNYNLFS